MEENKLIQTTQESSIKKSADQSLIKDYSKDFIKNDFPYVGYIDR